MPHAIARLSLALFLCAISAAHSPAYIANSRWAFTATDGAAGPLGSPVTLTWSIAPDGTLLPHDPPPAVTASEKVTKNDAPLTLVCERTADILEELGAKRAPGKGPVLIGFAAETSDVEARAKGKLARKRVDLIVANDVSAADAGFDVETNRVTLIDAEGSEALPLQSKVRVAAAVLDRVERLLAGKGAPVAPR